MEKLDITEHYIPLDNFEKHDSFEFYDNRDDFFFEKCENNCFNENQIISLEEKPIDQFDNNENENKDDILFLEDINKCQTPPEKEKVPNLIIEKITNAKTKVSTKAQMTTLGNKRRRTKEKEEKRENEEKEENEEKGENEEKEENEENEEKEKKKNLGRKKREEKNKGNHTKHSEDNIMRKIKSKFLNYMNIIRNKNIHNEELKLLKLNSEINENLKRDFNIELMKKTFKKLYEETPISSKYRKQTQIDANINKKTIEKIYNAENYFKEKGVINLLERNYIESFDDFRNNNLDRILSEVREEEEGKEENQKDIDEYLKNFEQLCRNYEKWFSEKKGRNRTKNEK